MKEVQEKSKAEFYKKLCEHVIDNAPEDSDHFHEKALVYRLKSDKGNTTIAEGVFECTYGSKLVQQRELLPEKVIMVVGTTGRGKSTLINRMINHIFGVESTDKFRFEMIVEEGSLNADRLTKNITKYVVFKSKLFFKLTIIDTPGFGYTEEKPEDDSNIQKIKNLFVSGAIKYINAICLVEWYSVSRLTNYNKRVYDTIKKIFSYDVKDNIFIMTTFCTSSYDDNKQIQQAPVLQLLKNAGFPFKASFAFNNTDIFIKPSNASDHDHWRTSMISFELFFDELNKITPVSTQLTKDVLQQVHIILHVKLPNFVRKLKNSIHLIDDHKENLKGIEMELRNPGEDFTYVANIETIRMVDIEEPGVFSTVCKKCDRVCHDPCTIKKDSDLWWCDTISWFNWKFSFYCVVCPDKCSWKDHTRRKQRPVRYTVQEFRTSQDLKEKYLRKKLDRKFDLMKSYETDMVSAYSDLLKDLEGIQECIDFVNDKCLGQVPTTLDKYLVEIIKKEENIKEDGYQKRRSVLENIITNMRKINIFKAFRQASDDSKLQQAKECYKDITI